MRNLENILKGEKKKHPLMFASHCLA
jgi:hypothetical protein